MDADDILARYRRYRELIVKHANEAMARVTSDTLNERGRQLGLIVGRSIVLDEEQEWPLVCDLALYTAPAGRSRAVDRHIKAVLPTADGEEAEVLRAMGTNRFSIWKVERHHDDAGLIMSDMIRGDEVWLVDEAFASVAKPGWISAMRLLPVAEFVINAGTLVPMVDELMLAAVMGRLTWVRDSDKGRLSGDPRIPVAVYRAALEQGALNRVRYREMDEPVPGTTSG